MRKMLAEDHGGKVVFGGLEGAGDGGACYVPPSLVLNPRPDAQMMTEEIFGPILPIIPVGALLHRTPPRVHTLYPVDPCIPSGSCSHLAAEGKLL